MAKNILKKAARAIPKIKAFALSLTGSGSIALIKINE